MNQPAAIDVQIVDIKNDPQHKGSIRITAHVPVERGAELTAALGWPTYTNPVPAALAVLDMNTGGPPFIPPAREAGPQQQTRNTLTAAPVSRLTGQAGMACRNTLFRKFLTHHGMLKDDTEYGAAVAVRFICGPDIHHPLDSRCEIILGTDAGDKWDALWGKFLAWKTAPEAVEQS